MEGKKLIGKRVRLIIGDGPIPEDEPGTIIGEDNTIKITSEEAKKYETIIGEEVRLTIGNDVNKSIENIIDTLKNSDNPQKEVIIKLSEEILKEKDPQNKKEKIEKLVSIGAGIASISMFIFELKTKLGF